MKAWRVYMTGQEPFTFITDQCETPEEVLAAMLEKFSRPAEKAEPL